MTVKQLIDKLSEFDSNLQVIIDADEYGYFIVNEAIEVKDTDVLIEGHVHSNRVNIDKAILIQ